MCEYLLNIFPIVFLKLRKNLSNLFEDEQLLPIADQCSPKNTQIFCIFNWVQVLFKIWLTFNDELGKMPRFFNKTTAVWPGIAPTQKGI